MKLQSSIAGFAGQPATLIGMFDEDTGVLVVAKHVKYRENRAADDFLLISNLELPALDCRFTDDDLKDAIQTFYTMKSQGTLDIPSTMQRYDPGNRIQQDKIETSGRKYLLHPDIDNGQVAVLALVSALIKQRPIIATLSAADELAEFYKVISI